MSGGAHERRVAAAVARLGGNPRCRGVRGRGDGAEPSLGRRADPDREGRADVRPLLHVERAVARAQPQPALLVRAQPDPQDDARDLRSGAGQPRVLGVGHHVLQRPARRADHRRDRPHRARPQAPRRGRCSRRDVHAGRHRGESRDRQLPGRPDGEPRGPPGRRAADGEWPSRPASARLRDHRRAPRADVEGSGRRSAQGRFGDDPHGLGPVLRQGQREVSRRAVSRAGPGRRALDHRQGRAARGRRHRDVRDAPRARARACSTTAGGGS